MSATRLYGVAKIKNSTLNIEYLWEKKIHFMQKIVNHSFRYMSLSSFRSKKVKKWIENKILTDKKTVENTDEKHKNTMQYSLFATDVFFPSEKMDHTLGLR